MAIPTSDSISITINLQQPTGPVADFSTVMGAFEHDVTTDRFSGPYLTIQQLEADGFTLAATPEIWTWASILLAQRRVTAFVGRIIGTGGGPASQVWQVDESVPTFVDQTSDYNDGDAGDWIVFPAAGVADDYSAIGSNEKFAKITLDSTGGTAGVGGVVVWEYWNGTAWTALSDVVDGTTGFTAALSAGQEVSWTVPLDWTPVILDTEITALFYVRAKITTPYGTDPLYTQGTAGGDANITASLTAIEEAPGAKWIFTNLESRDTAVILEAYTWHSTRQHFLVYQTKEAALKAGLPGNIAETLQGLSAQKVAGIWYADDSVYADASVTGYCAGFDLDAPGGRVNWRYKRAVGVTPSNLTFTEYNNIVGFEANLVDLWGSLNSFARGRVPDGNRIDTITTILWLEIRLTEAFVRLTQTTPTPYTQPGMEAWRGTGQAVFNTGVRADHFLGGEAGPTVTSLSLAEVPTADKESGTIRLTAQATLAGSIEAVDLIIDLQF